MHFTKLFAYLSLIKFHFHISLGSICKNLSILLIKDSYSLNDLEFKGLKNYVINYKLLLLTKDFIFMQWPGGGRRRKGSARILECFYLVGWHDNYHISSIRVCCWNNRGV